MNSEKTPGFFTETVTADGIIMRMAVIGSGKKTMVMLPGISVDIVTENAEAIANAYRIFKDEYTLYVFDRRSNIGDNYTTKEMAEDTVRVCKYLGLENIYLFGASQGGMIAQYIAAFHPELVKKLFLASTILKIADGYRHVMENWYRLALNGNMKELRININNQCYTEKTVQMLMSKFEFVPSDEDDEKCKRFSVFAKAILDFDSTSFAGKIKCPTVAVGGGKDAVFGGDSSRLLAERIGTECYIYEDYAHAVYDEAPDYTERIYSFFEK